MRCNCGHQRDDHDRRVGACRFILTIRHDEGIPAGLRCDCNRFARVSSNHQGVPRVRYIKDCDDDAEN